jgi:hypothetical protein
VTEVPAIYTDDENDLPRSIRHARDTITIDGKIDQDYRFLVYTFDGADGEIIARAYFDQPWEVSILAPTEKTKIDPPVMRYLQRRFRIIKQLGGPEGFEVIWRDERCGQG